MVYWIAQHDEYPLHRHLGRLLYHNVMINHAFHFKVRFDGSVATTSGLSLGISSAAVNLNPSASPRSE
jgi:hypothetical protein